MKLSMRTKAGYGMGQFGEGLAYNLFYFYYSYFMISVVGVNPALAGTLSGLAVIWDAITDPLIGFLSDNSRSKEGRRRAMMKKGLLPLALSLTILFLDLPVAMGLRLVIAFVVNLIFWVSFTMCDVPWATLGNEITEDIDEKTQLRTISTLLLNCGNLVVSGLTLPLVAWIGTWLGGEKLAWGVWAAVLGILSAVGFGISIAATKGLDHVVEENVQRQSVKQFFPQLFACLRIKYYIPLVLIALLMTMGYGIYSSGSVYLMQMVYGFNDTLCGAINTAGALLSMLCVAIIGWLSQRIDKKPVFIVCTLIAALTFGSSLLLPKTLAGYMVFVVGNSVGQGAFWTLIFAMAGDVCLTDTIGTGLQREGLMTSLLCFMTKLGTALGMWLIGVGLEMAGYRADVEVQAENVLSKMPVIINIPLVLLMIACVACLLSYRLTRKEYERVIQNSGNP